MTLTTHVYLLTEANPRDVFFKCRELIGATESTTWTDDRDDPEYVLRNHPGQSLCALLWVRYREGAMLRASHAEHDDEICDPGCDGRWHKPAHWIDVDFDTPYSYRDAQGRNCGALHASLVARLGNWLDDQGVMWAWQDEFTGEIHVGDKYERLFDLFKGGEDAERWLREIVTPAIERAFGSEGRIA